MRPMAARSISPAESVGNEIRDLAEQIGADDGQNRAGHSK